MLWCDVVIESIRLGGMVFRDNGSFLLSGEKLIDCLSLPNRRKDAQCNLWHGRTVFLVFQSADILKRLDIMPRKVVVHSTLLCASGNTRLAAS